MAGTNKKSSKNTYKLNLKFNGCEFSTTTDNIKSYLKSIKPFHLKTNVQFKCVNSNGDICNSLILSRRARMIWRNEVYMDMFINKLIFKKNA